MAVRKALMRALELDRVGACAQQAFDGAHERLAAVAVRKEGQVGDHESVLSKAATDRGHMQGHQVEVGGDRVAVASELSLEVLGQGERILADLVALVEREDAADAEIALAESSLAMGDLARALEMARRAMDRIGSSPEDEGAASSGSRIFDVLLALVRKAPDGGEAVDATGF